MNDYFLICCSTKDFNFLSDLISSVYISQTCLDEESLKKLNENMKFNIDFTHALTNNGINEYLLKPKGELPPFNSVKNAWCLSHTYWRHHEKEQNGYQNLEESVNLMIKCLDCAEKQKLNIKHCHCINMLSESVLDDNSESKYPVKIRLLSLIIKKDKKSNKYLRDTSFLYGEYELLKKDIGNIEKLL